MKIKHSFVSIIMLTCCICSLAFGQQQQPTYISADSLKKYQAIWIVDNWKFHAGDNREWAKPRFDDSSWELISTGLRQNQLPEGGWQDVGWFRLYIVVDSSL